MSSFQCKPQRKHIHFFDESFGEEKRKKNAVGKLQIREDLNHEKIFQEKACLLFSSEH